MVKNKITIVAKVMLVVCASIIFNFQLSTFNSNELRAQTFPAGDTVTEYPHKGTYYHDRFVGRKTASGEVFDQNKFTAAHWKIKLGTMVMVTNRNTGLQVIVKVNDRCPKHGVFDMTHRAAMAIGILGSQPVTIRILPEGYEKQWLAQEWKFDSVAARNVKPKPAVADNSARQGHPEAPEEVAEATVDKPERGVGKPVATPEKPKPAAVKKPTQHNETYNIELGIAKSHGEAFLEIERLPKIYQDKVLVEQLEESDQVKLTLEVRLIRNSALKLQRALLKTFPNAVMVPSE